MRKIMIGFLCYIFFFFNISLWGQTKIATSADYGALAESSMDKMIADSFGNYYVTYKVKTGGAYQMYVYTSVDSGEHWYPVGYGPVYSFPHDQRYGSLAIDKKGKIYAVWTGCDYTYTNRYLDPSDGQYKYGEYQVKFSSYENGRWSQWKNIAPVSGYAQWVATPPASIPAGVEHKYWQENPAIAVDSHGYIYVVWTGEDSQFEGSQIKFTKSLDSGKTWSQWKNLTSVTSGGTNFNQYRPNILIDKNDTIFIIWDGENKNQFSSGKPYSQVFCVTSSDLGKTWSMPEQITTYNKTQRFVASCYDPNTDKIHIVWSGRSSSDTTETKAQIQYGYYDGTWHVEAGFVGHTPGWEQKNPSITLSQSGRLYVMWSGNDDDHPYFDEGDPDTADDKTGHYIMMASKIPTGTWSTYKILDKGLYPHLLKSRFGTSLSWVYTRPDGWDDFALYFDKDTNITLLQDWVSSVQLTNIKSRIFAVPNLFCPQENTIMIKYIIGNRVSVKISVYNIAGERVAVLVNGIREAGDHQFYWDGGTGEFSALDNEQIGSSLKLSQGVFLLYMTINNHVEVKKIFIRN